MATGRGLRGRTVGRAGTSKAGQTDGRVDGQAAGSNRAKTKSRYARFWLFKRICYVVLVYYCGWCESELRLYCGNSLQSATSSSLIFRCMRFSAVRDWVFSVSAVCISMPLNNLLQPVTLVSSLPIFRAHQKTYLSHSPHRCITRNIWSKSNGSTLSTAFLRRSSSGILPIYLLHLSCCLCTEKSHYYSSCNYWFVI